MKIIYSLLVFFSLSLMFASCEPVDEDTTNETGDNNETETPGSGEADEESGTFQLFFNDSLIREGSTDKVGMITGLSTSYMNKVSLDNGTILQMILSGFSYSTGKEVILNGGGDDDAMISFMGWDLHYKDVEEMYFSISGTMTRTSSSKISFEGRCVELFHPLDTVDFRGYYESEAFKQIK